MPNSRQAEADQDENAPLDASARPFVDVERESYVRALDAAHGNVSEAARMLGLSRPKLDYRLRRLGVSRAVR
jgi:transcriptional regulator with GAF, ATPase, and Fis domain